MDVSVRDAPREEPNIAVVGLAGIDDAGPCGHRKIIDDRAAIGDKLTVAVCQLGVIDVLVNLPALRRGLPAIGGKRQLVLSEVATCAVGLDELLDLCLSHDLASIFNALHGRTGGSLDNRCMGIGVDIVLGDLGLCNFPGHLSKRLHLRVELDGDVSGIGDCQQDCDLELIVQLRTCRRNLNASLILYQEQQCLIRPAIQRTVHTDLVHDIGFLCTVRPDVDLPGSFAVVFDCLDAQDFQLVCIAADGHLFGQISTDRAGAAHGAGDGQCAAGERLRQQGGTGFCIAVFFPAHSDVPPILMVTVSYVPTGLPAAYACALIVLGRIMSGSATVACTQLAPTAPAAYAAALTARG